MLPRAMPTARPTAFDAPSTRSKPAFVIRTLTTRRSTESRDFSTSPAASRLGDLPGRKRARPRPAQDPEDVELGLAKPRRLQRLRDDPREYLGRVEDLNVNLFFQGRKRLRLLQLGVQVALHRGFHTHEDSCYEAYCQEELWGEERQRKVKAVSLCFSGALTVLSGVEFRL
jgi:hypothetical protein